MQRRGDQRWLLRLGLALLAVALAAGLGHAGEWAAVRRVNDGDTLELNDGRRVCYIGVDAPEIDHDRQSADPFGVEARARNAALVGSGKIRLEFDLERFDDYGRLLVYVFRPDGSLVNETLLREGLAFRLYKLPNVKHEGRLLAAQREAMRSGRGIWGNWQESGQRYVGNRNSQRFHRANCPEVRRIAPRNRIAFSKRWDAFWAGYAPSKECAK